MVRWKDGDEVRKEVMEGEMAEKEMSESIEMADLVEGKELGKKIASKMKL